MNQSINSTLSITKSHLERPENPAPPKKSRVEAEDALNTPCIVWASPKESIKLRISSLPTGMKIQGILCMVFLKLEGMSSSATFSVKEQIKKDLKGSWNFQDKFWALPLEFSLNENADILKVIGDLADKAHEKRAAEKEAASVQAAQIAEKLASEFAAQTKKVQKKPCHCDFFGLPPGSKCDNCGTVCCGYCDDMIKKDQKHDCPESK
jgi:hypothetical protein